MVESIATLAVPPNQRASGFLPNRSGFGQTAAALLQHRFACQVEEALRLDGRSHKWLADRTGLSQDQVSHILRGRQTVSVDALARTAHALGRVEVFPAPASLAELRP